MYRSGMNFWRVLQHSFRGSLPLLAFLLFIHPARAELVYSKSRHFRIPFQFDASELKRLGSREVQLYVSRDAGEHWKLVEGTSPESGKFTFEAGEDGVYWFSVKTVAASGLVYPAGPHQAGLHVLVDSAPPRLDLQLIEVEPGRVKLTWTAEDDNLDLASLKLEFRDSASDTWNVVAVRTHSYGQTSWTAPEGGTVQVRGEVSDLTGNRGEAQVSCSLEIPPVRNDKPDYGQPVANDSMTLPGSGIPSTGLTPRLTSATTGSAAISVQNLSSGTRTPAAPQDSGPSGKTSLQGVVLKVNSATFRVAYSLDGVGPSGVKQVDLYITEDNGQKWFYYGHDPDRNSPMDVTVPKDGEYGLAFRVTNGLGRVDIPPQPNDLPDVRITVDRTPPIVKLMPLENAPDQEANAVMISWSAHDQDLADRPVALFYSMTATGPWEPIADWQPNSERFIWKLPPTLDQPFYIRLDARDKAGNVSKAYAEKPFVVDRARPRARITEIAPIGVPTR